MWWKKLLVVLVMMGMAACAQGTAVVEPPVIRYGEDLCAECNMIISDVRFAASYVHEIAQDRYASLTFDDIGDMLAHAEKHPEHAIVAWYVHDYGTEEWIDAEQSYFIMSESIRSPMGYGIAAHATVEAAEDFAATVDGEIVGWAELGSVHLVSEHADGAHEHHH